eukprot:3342406-Rhodomonas_salina.1
MLSHSTAHSVPHTPHAIAQYRNCIASNHHTLSQYRTLQSARYNRYRSTAQGSRSLQYLGIGDGIEGAYTANSIPRNRIRGTKCTENAVSCT